MLKWLPFNLNVFVCFFYQFGSWQWMHLRKRKEEKRAQKEQTVINAIQSVVKWSRTFLIKRTCFMIFFCINIFILQIYFRFFSFYLHGYETFIYNFCLMFSYAMFFFVCSKALKKAQRKGRWDENHKKTFGQVEGNKRAGKLKGELKIWMKTWSRFFPWHLKRKLSESFLYHRVKRELNSQQ